MSEFQARSSTAFGRHWLPSSRANGNGEVITFYSYKGGTGRSMALVNCAGLIAQQLPTESKPILLVDFDLEAPGLHRYLSPYLGTPESWTHQSGVLELFEGLLKIVERSLADREAPQLDDEAAARIVDSLDLSAYVIRSSLSSMLLLKAGRFDESYDSRLSNFDWEILFSKAPALFRCLAERLARDYTYVFVDSRTGLSDITGVCTMLLPDVLVMVFTPNNQSLTGVEHLVRKAVSYRASSSDLRSLRVYPLPSRVDNQVEHFRQIWRMGGLQHPLFGDVVGYEPMFVKVFQDAIGTDGDAKAQIGEYFDVVQIPHSSDYAYGERLCFDSAAVSDSLSVRNAYEEFLKWVVTASQPWQRPAEVLLEQKAIELLANTGVTSLPNEDTSWIDWFDRLSTLINTEANPVLTQASLLSDGLRANVNLAIALALAHGGQLQRSTELLEKECIAIGTENYYSALARGLVELLILWRTQLTPTVLATEDRSVWLIAARRVLEGMNAPQSVLQRWTEERTRLTDYAPWLVLTPASLRHIRESDLSRLGENAQAGMLATIKNLALARKADGDLAGARSLEEKLLELHFRALGEAHPATLTSMENLARTLKAQGDRSGARELERKARDFRRRLAGETRRDKTSALTLRVFISSPGDVAEERGIAREVMKSLEDGPLLRDKVRFEVIGWDDQHAGVPMVGREAPPASINRYIRLPAECDLTLVILWSRIGTLLPFDSTRSDGTRYESGTVWEYEDALAAGKPVFLYRRTAKIQVDLDDPDFAHRRDQYDAVKNFFGRFTRSDSFSAYANPADFAPLLHRDLEAFVNQRLGLLSQHAPLVVNADDPRVTRVLTLIDDLRRKTGRIDERDAEVARLRRENEELRRAAIARTLTAAAQPDASHLAVAAAEALQTGETRPAEDLLREQERKEARNIGTSGADDVQRRREVAKLAREQGSLAMAHDIRAALEAYQRAAGYEPDHTWTLFSIGELYMRLGDLSAAMESHRKAAALVAARLMVRDDDVMAQRDLSVSHHKIGDLLRAQGDGPGALAEYRTGHAIAQALTTRDPTNTVWQRDLSISYDKIGELLQAQGDGPGALAAYRKGLVIVEALAAHNPNNTAWQRDLSVCHDNIGKVLYAQGNGPGTLAAFRNALAIREALAAGDPANTEWQRDLSVSHSKIGRVLRAQGDGPGALASFRKDLAIAEALSARDPANTQWQRDVSVSHNEIGSMLEAQSDYQGALASYSKSLAIAEALASRDPANTQWQRDLFVSHTKMGEVLHTQGDGQGAIAAYGKGHAIVEALATRDPTNTEWQRDLSVSYIKIAEVLQRQGEHSAALAAYGKARAIIEALAARDPANTDWQRDLSVSQTKIAEVLQAQGDEPAAHAAYLKGLWIVEALAARDPVNAEWQADLAMSYSRLGTIEHDQDLDTRIHYLQRAREILLKLKDEGRLLPNQDWIEWIDALLATLSSDPT